MTDTIAPPRPSGRPGRDAGDRVVEDPRIARRRQEVVAAGRRRRRILLIAVATVVGLGAAAFGVLRSSLLDVDRVLVAGSNSVDREQVVRASGIGHGDAMVDVDAAAARAAVMAVPGVASARVELDWPGTVRISVTDEQPLAVLGVDGRRVLVGRGGRVIEPLADGDQPALPLITPKDAGLVDGLVPGAQVPDELVPAVVVLEQVTEPLRSRLGGIDVGADGDLTLLLAPGEGDGTADDGGSAGDGARTGGSVAFGRPSDLPAKLLAASSMLAAANVRCLDVLDVTEPLRPTISRRDGCDPGPPTVGATTTVPARSAPQGTGQSSTKGTGRTSPKGTDRTTTSTTKGATSATSTRGGG